VNEARANTLITVDELAQLIDAQAAVVVLDVIDEQGSAPEGRPKIPGSLSAHLATDFSGTPTAASGRRPLPDVLELQAKARAWGICNDSAVVVYDNSGGAQASRAWWTLRWAGLSNVRVLDGGYDAWAAANRPSSNHVATCATEGDVVLRAGCMPTIDADEAAKLAKQSRLLDARPLASYVGDPAKAGTGHIPGAVHAPVSDNIADGKFKPSDDLHVRYSGLGAQGATPVGVYCGSGNAAAHSIAAMSASGVAAALYVGSWSAWSADPSRPVATGFEPK